MGLKIYICSKVQFNNIIKDNNIDDLNIESFKKAIFICIDNTEGNDFYSEPIFKDNHLNVLHLKFDDVEIDINEDVKAKSITKEQAKEIVDFLYKNKDKELLFVHCTSGISRSGAVGLFALDYFNGDKEHFKTYNKHICLNQKVLRLLKQNYKQNYDNKRTTNN
jgi:rhodanese-related sulfurtransferase